MTISEIYKKYRINSGLQMHQLRAAGVAHYICERSKKSVDAHAVVSACLLHDMGNIIKADMTTFPELWQPEGTEYWSRVKEERIREYGNDEHAATIAIAGEIGVGPEVLRLIRNIGFANLKHAIDSELLEQKICEYSDVRVGLYGVLTMRERLENWYERYRANMTDKGVDARAYYEELVRGFEVLENQLVDATGFSPEAITDEIIAPAVADLRGYTI